jgi:hypothetical protein
MVAEVKVTVGAVESEVRVTVIVVVAVTDDTVTATVIVFVPRVREIGDEALPDDTADPFTVIVALPLDAVGVTVINDVAGVTVAEYPSVPASNTGENVPLDNVKPARRVSGTAAVPVDAAVPDWLFSFVFVTMTRICLPTSSAVTTNVEFVAPDIAVKLLNVAQLAAHDCHS